MTSKENTVQHAESLSSSQASLGHRLKMITCGQNRKYIPEFIIITIFTTTISIATRVELTRNFPSEFQKAYITEYPG